MINEFQKDLEKLEMPMFLLLDKKTDKLISKKWSAEYVEPLMKHEYWHELALSEIRKLMFFKDDPQFYDELNHCSKTYYHDFLGLTYFLFYIHELDLVVLAGGYRTENEALNLPEEINYLNRLFFRFPKKNKNELLELSDFIQKRINYFLCDEEKLLFIRMVAKLKEDFSVKYTLKDLAKEFACSDKKIQSCFHSCTKMPFQKYCLQMKFEYSKELLKHTDLSVDEIAVKIGYTYGNTYSKIFKERYGLSPTEYRIKEQAILASFF